MERDEDKEQFNRNGMGKWKEYVCTKNIEDGNMGSMRSRFRLGVFFF